MKLKVYLTLGLVTLSLAACNGNGPQEVRSLSSDGIAKAEGSSQINTSNNKILGTRNYQDILDEYTKKLQETTSMHTAEYNDASVNNQKGVQGLIKNSVEKLSKLTDISTEGISKMTEVHVSSGSESSDEYEEWAKKLQDAHDAEAQKIVMDTLTQISSPDK